MPESISQKIMRNTSFSILARIVRTGVYLVVIPFIIQSVGETRYGIWVALFAFVDYFNLLDLGFGAATVKYTADYYARENIFEVGQTIITAGLFYLLVLPLIFIPIFFTDSILRFFHVAPKNLNEAIFVLRGVVLIFAFNQTTSIFRNVLIGLQRMDVQNLCEIVQTFLYGLGVILVLRNGLGLKGLILVVGVLRVLLVAAYTLSVFKIVPGMKQGLRHFSGKMFKEFFAYGIKLQITSIAGLFNFQLDKILIGHFLRLELVTFYELGSKIAMFIRQMPSVFLVALIPASAELAAKGDRKRLGAMHMSGARYITLMTAPIAFFLGTMAPTVMLVWMGGNDYPYAILTIRILCIGYFFNILTGVTTSMVRGVGIVHYEMYTSLFVALSNLTLSLGLIIKIGFPGALIGTAASMTAGNILYLYRFNHYMETAFRTFLKDTFIKPVLVASVAGAIIWSSQYSVLNNLTSISISRINMAIYLILSGTFFALIYSGGLFLVGFITRSDLRIFGKIAKSICVA